MCMEQYHAISRGSDKSILGYFQFLHNAYLSGTMSKEEYISMVAAARVLLFNQDEDEAMKWAEQVLKEV